MQKMNHSSSQFSNMSLTILEELNRGDYDKYIMATSVMPAVGVTAMNVKTEGQKDDQEPQPLFPGVDIPWYEGCVYQCNLCGMYFWNQSQMHRHMSKNHDKEAT